MISVRVVHVARWWRHISNRLSQNTWLRRLFISPYAIPTAVFCCYFLLNLGIGGPAYMSDEVGYLEKAATIAGSVVHATTSWFGGYSLLISPAFLLSANPFTEWHIILALNALMWAVTAWLLQYILRYTHPEASLKAIRLSTLGAMLYPSWLSMSGYAFATSGFVLVFVAALAALIRSKLVEIRWLCLSGALAGYLCWMHPLGALFLGLLVAFFTLQSILKKQWRFVLAAMGGVTVVLCYVGAVHPLLNHVMRGSVVNDEHYSQSFSEIVHAALSMHTWLQAGELLVGLVFFTVVATFGLAAYAALPILRQLYDRRRAWRKVAQDVRLMVMLLSLLAVVVAILCNALTTGTVKQPRIDQWVYGRYTDMYLLPLLAFGLLAIWRAKQAVVLSVFALSAGVFLSLVTNPDNTAFIFNNKVNLQGLWPMHIASVVHANAYWAWGLIGAVGIAATGLAGSVRHKPRLALLLVPVALAMAGNYLYHRTIVRQAATVSSLYQYITTNYSRTDCIGFTVDPDGSDRFSLYSYYLHGYNLRKITPELWQQDHCTGPYLTYDLAAVADTDAQIIGQEVSSGLYVVTSDIQAAAHEPLEFK